MPSPPTGGHRWAKWKWSAPTNRRCHTTLSEKVRSPVRCTDLDEMGTLLGQVRMVCAIIG